MLTERARLGGYREFAPPRELHGIAAALWSYSRPRGTPPIPQRGHRLLPDADLSLAFDRQSGVILLIGPIVTPHFFAPEEGFHLDAVRLHPEWCRDLFGIETGELLDEIREYRAPQLRERLLRSPEPLLELAREVATRRVSPEARVANQALRVVRASRSTLRLDRIARSLSLSERHLRRVVRDTAGFSPKQLQRIARFDRAIAAADRQISPDWARIAGEHGYYDQAHLIEEFQALAGCTPAELTRERALQRPVSEISNRGTAAI